MYTEQFPYLYRFIYDLYTPLRMHQSRQHSRNCTPAHTHTHKAELPSVLWELSRISAQRHAAQPQRASQVSQTCMNKWYEHVHSSAGIPGVFQPMPLACDNSIRKSCNYYTGRVACLFCQARSRQACRTQTGRQRGRSPLRNHHAETITLVPIKHVCC